MISALSFQNVLIRSQLEKALGAIASTALYYDNNVRGRAGMLRGALVRMTSAAARELRRRARGRRWRTRLLALLLVLLFGRRRPLSCDDDDGSLWHETTEQKSIWLVYQTRPFSRKIEPSFSSKRAVPWSGVLETRGIEHTASTSACR